MRHGLAVHLEMAAATVEARSSPSRLASSLLRSARDPGQGPVTCADGSPSVRRARRCPGHRQPGPSHRPKAAIACQDSRRRHRCKTARFSQTKPCRPWAKQGREQAAGVSPGRHALGGSLCQPPAKRIARYCRQPEDEHLTRQVVQHDPRRLPQGPLDFHARERARPAVGSRRYLSQRKRSRSSLASPVPVSALVSPSHVRREQVVGSVAAGSSSSSATARRIRSIRRRAPAALPSRPAAASWPTRCPTARALPPARQYVYRSPTSRILRRRDLGARSHRARQRLHRAAQVRRYLRPDQDRRKLRRRETNRAPLQGYPTADRWLSASRSASVTSEVQLRLQRPAERQPPRKPGHHAVEAQGRRACAPPCPVDAVIVTTRRAPGSSIASAVPARAAGPGQGHERAEAARPAAAHSRPLPRRHVYRVNVVPRTS